MDPATVDTVVFVSVILVRLLAPLFIPLFPLPAIITCLVVDAVDRDIFRTLGGFDPESYQGIDKALDIFYLTVAMLAVLRNWSQQTAARTARFLFYYRLVGVAAFELTGWRPLLVIFPNTFEYFFIFYEWVRGRRSPTLMTGQFYIVAAAAIWIVIKLPQEWWIHIAQLDVTDALKQTVFGVETTASWGEALTNRPWVLLVIGALAVGLWLGLRALSRAYIAPPQHPMRLAADPLPAFIDEARERAALVSGRWRVLDARLGEKILLVALVSIIFGQVIPDVEATPLQLTVGVAVVATINAVLSLRAARAGRTIESAALSFGLLAAVNVLLFVVADFLLRRGDGEIDAWTTLFFLLMLTLMVTLYDRFRPVYDARFAVDEPQR
jgi:hypothetical protein